MHGVDFTGRNATGQRVYEVEDVTHAPGQKAQVVAIDEETWTYECARCQSRECAHVGAVCDARSVFEYADARMGDATP